MPPSPRSFFLLGTLPGRRRCGHQDGDARPRSGPCRCALVTDSSSSLVVSVRGVTRGLPHTDTRGRHRRPRLRRRGGLGPTRGSLRGVGQLGTWCPRGALFIEPAPGALTSRGTFLVPRYLHSRGVHASVFSCVHSCATVTVQLRVFSPQRGASGSPSPPPQPLATTSLLFVSIDLPSLDVSREWNCRASGPR